MRIRNGSFLIILGFLAVQNNLHAQGLPEKIQEFMGTYQSESPPEKIHLHLDKHTLTLGEDLWFSAYLTAGSTQIPSPLSKTLYVDLFDGDGILLEQRILEMNEGRGNGDFAVPLFGKPGIYQLKAYTAWMRNFGEEFFFTTQVHVVDGAGGSFLPQFEIQEIRSSEAKATYQTQLTAINQSGNPLSGETIQLIIKGDGEAIHTQDVQLNSDGQASFSFSIPEKPFAGLHAELIFLENDSYPVHQKIKLPYSLSLADIQFLPEGGQWVLGKKANLAFRAVDPDGQPLQLQGRIEEADISFESNFAGLGQFQLTPTGTEYRASLENPKTKQSRLIKLPEPQETGLSMQVLNNAKASYITVFIQGNTAPETLLLVSQTRGIVNYMIQGALTNGVWGVRIPKENLIGGINQITILTEQSEPILERLLFIHPKQTLQLDASLSDPIRPRQNLTLNLTNALGEAPATGTFSVAVLDADQVKDERDIYGTISSQLLLQSDLPGTIHHPGYYFKDQTPETLAALDLVMLTHGWRRFTWEEVRNQQLPEVQHFIERGINIEGQVTDSEQTRKGLGGGKITALVGQGIEIVTTEFGPNGRFIFKDLMYQDSAKVTITAEDSRKLNFVDVEVIRPDPVFTKLPGTYPTGIQWPKALAASYEARNMMKQLNQNPDMIDLEGVTVAGKTIQEEEEEIRKIYGAGDVSIDPEKIPSSVGFTNVFQLIQGRVAGVQVILSGANVTVTIRGQGSLNSGTQPLFLLDNFPVDAGTLLQLNPRDVASIDVFKDPAKAAIFGAQGANGVIAVYTKTGSGVSTSVGGTLVTTYGGYSVAREFYTPDYSEKSPQTSVEDQRATIYWNPQVSVDESGSVNLEFYNSDQAKRQLIIVEGMNDSGVLGQLSKILD